VLSDLPLAATHPGSTRLSVSVIVLIIFTLTLPRPAPRPLAVAALYALVVIWDFGATLIWGTGGPTKLRFQFTLTGAGGWALLACAIVGILAAAAALRSFGRARNRAGAYFAGVFAIAFAAWSLAVRYSPVIATIGLFTGCAALLWAAKMPSDVQPAHPEHPTAPPQANAKLLLALSRLILPPLCGFLYYASLRWGPKTWTDPECGATLIVPAFVAAVSIPTLTVGLTTRATGRRTETVLASAILVALLTAAACVLVFLIWFGQNHCGE
jgi:hypothetical protein